MDELKEKTNGNQIFGSFLLSNSEFALSVSFVQEVVNVPDSYTSVPLAPSYLKGLFNLRGTVMPVLDLSELLNLKSSTAKDDQKIAIVELEGVCVGLLFDKTGEVFRSNEDERSDFESNNTSGVVCGVFKKDNGKRIVQILDLTRVFKLHNVPKDSSRSRLERENQSKKRGARKQCISFIVGPAKCALPISDIQEILKIDKLSETALSVGNCIGTIDLRGFTVPVIDFCSLLNYREVDRSEEATHGNRRIVVMRLENELFGLMVDSVDSIVSFFPDELLTFPLVEQKKVEMFVGCITGHGETDILLLDHQKILSHDEVRDITRGHSKIYQNHSASSDTKTKGGSRRTFITFKVHGTYAVGINEVKEIIEFPQQLLQPPGLKKHVKGVLNLRGNLVTIIDARNLYQTSAEENNVNPNAKKVLVFTKNGVSFGLIVDSVESIITFSDNDKIKLPKMIYNTGETGLSADISEAVEVTDSSGSKKSMLIINIDSVFARATDSLAA